MNSKIKILVGILVVGIVLVGGRWVCKSKVPISPLKPELKVSIDGNLETISDTQLPINKTEAETIVKGFCESKDSRYAYALMEKVDDDWRIPMSNINGPYYATVNIETGETKCIKQIPFEPQEVTIITDKTEYEIGKPVKITITNNKDEPIYTSPYNAFPSTYFISKFVDSKWKRINQNCQCEYKCTDGVLTRCPQYVPPAPYFREFKSPFTGEWRQTECVSKSQMCGDMPYTAVVDEQVEPGKYKAEFCYWDKKDIDLTKQVDYAPQDKKKCVEREFTIK